MTEKTDHDLLIELNTKVDMFIKQVRAHEDMDAREHAIFQKDIKAAHRRMDGVTIGGIFAIVILGVSMWLK